MYPLCAVETQSYADACAIQEDGATDAKMAHTDCATRGWIKELEMMNAHTGRASVTSDDLRHTQIAEALGAGQDFN